MRPPAREQLGIIWRGEQVPGVPFSGLFAADGRPRPLFPEHLWPVEVEVESFTLHGAAWEVLLWEVAVTGWPSGAAWQSCVRGTFEALIDAGARVAWIGDGLLFCDPPTCSTPPACRAGWWRP